MEQTGVVASVPGIPVSLHGRRQPYSEKGIRRLPCVKCGLPAHQQWQICSDDNLYRPICLDCDIALNALVLEWIGFPDWQEKLQRYKESW